jgi:flagellar FliJ protein
MSQFKFRLQNVQTLRERLRDEAADSLQQAMLAIQKLTEQMEQIQTEFAHQAQLQSQASSGVIDTQRVLESQRYQTHLLSEIDSVRNNISLIEQECERRKQILIKREQDVRSLDKLRESQLSQHQHAQTIAAQGRLDEWAGFHFWKDSQANKLD